MIPIAKKASWSGGWATLRDLEIIQAVIDMGSVTNAAEQLGISQPAVSQALNQIEKRCGKQLFNRENNKIVPNSDALLLYQEIKRISESFARLTQFHYQESKQSLRVLVSGTMAYGFINHVTAQFIKKHQFHISLDIIRNEQLLPLIIKDQADIAISFDVAINSNSNLNTIPLRKTKLICALPKSHPLCENIEITPEDIHETPFISLIKNNPTRNVIDRTLHKLSIKPDIVAEVSDQETALLFVKEALGISLVNSFPLIESDDIVYRPFSIDIPNTLYFLTSQKMTREIQLFIEFIKQNQPDDDEFSTAIR